MTSREARNAGIATKLAPGRPEKVSRRVSLDDGRRQHCALFAAASAGFVLVSIDPTIEDPAKLRAILAETDCKMLIYDEPDVDLVASAVPEFSMFWAKRAKPFYVRASHATKADCPSGRRLAKAQVLRHYRPRQAARYAEDDGENPTPPLLPSFLALSAHAGLPPHERPRHRHHRRRAPLH